MQNIQGGTSLVKRRKSVQEERNYCKFTNSRKDVRIILGQQRYICLCAFGNYKITRDRLDRQTVYFIF